MKANPTKQKIKCPCGETFIHYTPHRNMKKRKFCDECLRKKGVESSKRYARKKKEENKKWTSQ